MLSLIFLLFEKYGATVTVHLVLCLTNKIEHIVAVIKCTRFYFYCSHPKDGEGTVFTGVCLFTPWGGGQPLSQVLFKVLSFIIHA